jgi:hypothetical protein
MWYWMLLERMFHDEGSLRLIPLAPAFRPVTPFSSFSGGSARITPFCQMKAAQTCCVP